MITRNSKEEKQRLNGERLMRKTIATIEIAIDNVKWNPIRRNVMLISVIAAVIIFCIRGHMWLEWNIFNLDYFHYSLSIAVELMIALTIILFFCGHPYLNIWLEAKFRRIGLVNSAGEPPFLNDSLALNDDNCLVMKMDSTGIPLTKWQDMQDAIENVLNGHIVRLTTGRSMSTVIVELYRYSYEPYSIIPWNNKYLSSKDFEIALGKSFLGVEYADLNIVSHALIAGSTGSGKTIMMMTIIVQCLLKKAFVVLIDFKGGASYPRKLRQHSRLSFVSDERRLDMALTWALSVIDARKQLFADADCEDIIEYNRKYNTDLSRVVLAFDEVAQVLDKTGLSTVDKKSVAELEHKVATIARLGRAFGVHLVLGLQRPDATIINGQIKSNIDLRMCGRSDDTLSMIVLDTTDASREIGEKDRGKFVLSNGHTIQGFYVTEDDIDIPEDDDIDHRKIVP